MSVRDERSSTSAGPVGLRGSQEQQGGPGELTHLRLLATDRKGLNICPSLWSSIHWLLENLLLQRSSFAHRDSPHPLWPWKQVIKILTSHDQTVQKLTWQFSCNKRDKEAAIEIQTSSQQFSNAARDQNMEKWSPFYSGELNAVQQLISDRYHQWKIFVKTVF